MKRDWDLVRKILLEVEQLPVAQDLNSDALPGYEDQSDVVAAHMRLLYDAGLIDGIDSSAIMRIHFMASGLTWEGHEFLDKIRADTVWNKVKVGASEKGLSLSIDVISGLALAMIKRTLELP